MEMPRRERAVVVLRVRDISDAHLSARNYRAARNKHGNRNICAAFRISVRIAPAKYGIVVR